MNPIDGLTLNDHRAIHSDVTIGVGLLGTSYV